MGSEVDHNTMGSEVDHNTMDSEVDHNTMNSEFDHNTMDSEVDNNTKCWEVDHGYMCLEDDEDRRRRAGIVYSVIMGCLAVAGTLVNLWFLAAILTSAEMRSRLRNKIIVIACIAHLPWSALIISWLVRYLTSNDGLSCSFFDAHFITYYILKFIANWLVVMLVAVFLAQIQDFNPTTRLTPRATTLCTLGLMLLPWVASVIFVPIVYFSSTYVIGDCSNPTPSSYKILISVDTAVPISLAIVLVVTAAALMYRRYLRGYIQVELITRGPEIDTIFVYVAVVVVSLICDYLGLIHTLDASFLLRQAQNIATIVELNYVMGILNSARLVLMPLAWFLLPDIRQRLKTWRPWRRSTSGIDLTVTYRREDNEQL